MEDKVGGHQAESDSSLHNFVRGENIGSMGLCSRSSRDDRDYRPRKPVSQGVQIRISTEDLGTALHKVAEAGNAQRVRSLINAGVFVDSRNEDGLTPLMMASSNGHGDVVLMLLNAGASVNTPNNLGFTPIFFATQHNHADVVRILIDFGTDVNAASKEGIAPIFTALLDEKEAILRMLVDAGANLQVVDKDGFTPVCLAASCDKSGVMQVLIDAGANVNTVHNGGYTPIFIAAQYGNADIVRVLIGAGADVNVKEKDGFTPIHIASQNGHTDAARVLIDAGSNVNTENKYGSTPLYTASSNGHFDTVRMLIDANANVNSAKMNGCTPLYAASSNGHVDIVRVLIEAGGNVNTATNDGFTPIYAASFEGHVDVVRMLIDAGANVDAAQNNGLTSLMIAADKNQTETAFVLIRAGADPYLKDANNKTALDYASPELRTKIEETLRSTIDSSSGDSCALFRAIKSGQISVLKQIGKFNTSVREVGGCTPLMVALQSGRHDIVKLILYRGNNVQSMLSERDDNGKTVLHYVAEFGNVAIARLLLAEGADLRVRDADGITAIADAAAHGNLEVLQTFISHAQSTSGISRSEMSASLKCAIASKTASTQVEAVVEYLLNASLIEDLNVMGEDGSTALHAAARKPEGEHIVEMLVRNGADINAKTMTEGDAALHLASQSGNSATVRFLVSQANIQLDIRNQFGQTPLLVSLFSNQPEIATALINGGADPNSTDGNGESALLHATRRQLRDVVVSLLQHGARVDASSLATAKQKEIQSVLHVYQMSQQFHERSLSMLSKAATGSSPTFEQIMDLVPIITSVYDLRTVLVLCSTLIESPECKSKTLNAALRHILTQKLVLDDDACAFFHLALDHCVESVLMSPYEYEKWKVQVTKVNMESADWVVELKKQVNENSYRLKVQDEIMQTVVKTIHNIHADIMANRKAVNAVNSRVSVLQNQVDVGKKLLERVVVHSNQLQQRLRQCESNIQTVANNLQSFQTAYTQRLEYEESMKKRKAVLGLVVSVIGFAFAPVLKTVFDSVIDLASPIEIFKNVFSEGDIVQFLADETWEGVLKPAVEEQLEKFAIPVGEFETILRQEIITTKPELVAECKNRGLTVTVFDDKMLDEVKARVPTLVEHELLLANTIRELEIAASVSANESNDTRGEDPRWSIGSGCDGVSFPGLTAEIQDLNNSKSNASNSSTDHPNYQGISDTLARTDQEGASPSTPRESKMALASVNATPSPTNSNAPTQFSSNQDDDSSFTLPDGEIVMYVDDLDMFPYHFAVHSSGGDLKAFLDLAEVIDDSSDDLNAVMKVQRTRTEAFCRSIDAGEYAFLVGYREIGEAVATMMEEFGVPAPNSALFTASRQASTTVTFAENVEEYPFVFAVHESGGDLNEYETLASIIDCDDDAIDAKIPADVVQRTVIGDESWSAVELASHFGYVGIVRHLLVTKRVKTSAKSVVVLRRTMSRAKVLGL